MQTIKNMKDNVASYQRPLAEVADLDLENVVCESGYNDEYIVVDPWDTF